ncbi:MAG: T9SS type A sorting domain-containing protein, partial [Candidatus Kapaibacterium sp.]
SDVSVQSADVGTAFCERFIDTYIVVTNTGSARITVADLRLDRPGCLVIDTLPVTIAAGDSLRVRVRVKTGSVRGSDSVTALVRVLPCDTVYACMLRWIRDTRPGAVSPRAVRMQETFSCSAVSIDTTVSCLIGRDEGTVHTVLCEGSVSYTGTLPLLITRSTAVPLAVRWTPMPMATRGRAGLVVRSDGCDDTLWVEVDGMARMPRISAPDSVETGPILVCADSAVVVDFALRSADSTLWRIMAVSAPPEVALDRTIGDSAMGVFSIRARVTPQRVGAFAYPVDITVRPCDTTVRIWVQGTGITAILSHTDTLTITEPMVGRSTITSVVLHNTGTEPVTISGIDHAPRDPFATVAFVPDLPCIIASGDSLRCFIRLLQECGDHVDSLVFLTTNPCAPREKLVLNSQARAVTRFRIPDVEVRVGDTGVVPVLMDGRPSIETSMLDSFTVEIAVRPADLWVTDGADDRCSWMCTSGDSLTRIRINGRWRNDDTIAVIPVRTLLSTAVSTPVTFDRNSGFGWTAHPCDVAYTDGSVIFGDVCGSRWLRSVSWSPTPTYVVAPNPTSGELSIIPTGTHPSPYLLTIVDALGMVRETVACAGMQVIDLRHLPDGMYGLRLVSGADLQTRCVIKR